MSGFTFWGQAGALALAVLALYLRDWPRTWRAWREVLAAIAVSVALFALISGGRGCAGPSPLRHDIEVEDAPDPFGRS